MLSEEVFVNDSTLAQYLEREELDALKLWRLSVLLYAMIMGCNVAELSISVADQYLDLFNHLNDGMNVASIEVVGRLPTETKKGKSSTKTKKFTISSQLLINKMKQAYLEPVSYTHLDYSLPINTQKIMLQALLIVISWIILLLVMCAISPVVFFLMIIWTIYKIITVK